MRRPLRKAQENMIQPEVHMSSRRRSATQSAFQRLANRPEARAWELQTLAAHSTRAVQAARLQDMANNYTSKRPIQHETDGPAVRSLQGEGQSAIGYSNKPLLQPLVPRVVQRYVYIGLENGPLFKKVRPTDHEEINGWLSDNVHRHFLNEQEMKAYSKKETDHIGVIDNDGTPVWTRLNPDKLTVAGEIHSAPVTTMDLVKAMNIKKFKYEGFYVITPSFIDNYGSYAQMIIAGNLLFNEEHGLPVDKYDHQLEEPDVSVLFDLMRLYKKLSDKSLFKSLKPDDALTGMMLYGLYEGILIARDVAKKYNYTDQDKNMRFPVSYEEFQLARIFNKKEAKYEDVFKVLVSEEKKENQSNGESLEAI